MGTRSLLGMLVALGATAASAADYHVSPTGNDLATGTSPATAWATIDRVNSVDLEPGDRVLFEGGATFAGNLRLDAADAGTPTAPVVVTSFGSGRAAIDAGSADGVFVDDAAGIEIRELDLVGDGPAVNTGRGIYFHTERSDGAKLEHVRIDHVDVSGFRRGGIVLSSDHPSLPGYRDVEITHSKLFGNGETGINMGGFFRINQPALSHEDVYIAHCELFDNFGDPTDLNSHTGSGIIVAATDGALIEFNRASNNGGINSKNSGGPVGIWTWNSNDVTIQFNIADHNKTGGGADGGGFDLDGGVSNSVVQYNYSYENEGAGVLLAQFSLAGPFRDNVVRYNVSANDGRRNSYGGIVLFTDFFEDMRDTAIYGNTIYLEPAAAGTPRAVHAFIGTYRNVTFRNNIFMGGPGLQLVRTFQNLPPSAMAFQGNLYWTVGGDFEIELGNDTYASLAEWQATGQETIDGVPTGIHADPLLASPAMPEPLTDPTQLAALAAFRLEPGSPAIDAGLDLSRLFGIGPGARDFHGTPLPQRFGLDIGAAEMEPPGGIGVRARKLLLIDKQSASGKARAVYLAKDRDAGITKGPATDPGAITARFDLVVDGVRSAFDMPAGTDDAAGWRRNTTRVAKYASKAATAGSVRSAVITPGRSLKLVARDLGEPPLDLFASESVESGVFSAYTVQNGADETRHCTTFAPSACKLKEIARGAGRKLTCRRGSPDPTCAAAR